MALRELTVNDAHAHRHVCLRVVLLRLMLELLLQAKATIANKNVVYLLEVEVDVIMMVRVLPPVPLALPLLFWASSRAMHLLSSMMLREAILCVAVLFHALQLLLCLS